MFPDLNQEKPRKILLIGLDNCGKTSILISFKKETNLLSYFSLKPTKGLSIERFSDNNKNIVCWDLGGQKQYREEYLRNFDKYIKDIIKIIYIIDVQDIDRYDISLNYLTNLITLLKNYSIKVEISFFLHKYDPNLQKLERFKNINEIVDSKLISKIKEIIPSEFSFDIYKTTIYTVFEKTLY